MRPFQIGDEVKVFWDRHLICHGHVLALGTGITVSYLYVQMPDGTTRYALRSQSKPAGKTYWTWRHIKAGLLMLKSKLERPL